MGQCALCLWDADDQRGRASDSKLHPPRSRKVSQVVLRESRAPFQRTLGTRRSTMGLRSCDFV